MFTVDILPRAPAEAPTTVTDEEELLEALDTLGVRIWCGCQPALTAGLDRLPTPFLPNPFGISFL